MGQQRVGHHWATNPFTFHFHFANLLVLISSTNSLSWVLVKLITNPTSLLKVWMVKIWDPTKITFKFLSVSLFSLLHSLFFSSLLSFSLFFPFFYYFFIFFFALFNIFKEKLQQDCQWNNRNLYNAFPEVGLRLNIQKTKIMAQVPSRHGK